ncbi:MAG: thioredoxin family protein [Prevotella sp.]|nr:thioredoxin family protein [Prevotella sp.]
MKTNYHFSLLALLLCMMLPVQAQMQDPVKFNTQLKTGSGAEAEMIFSATIDPGWHVYSTNLGQDGPIEASLHVNKMDGAELVGKLTPKGKEISQFDEMFGMNLRYFENAVTFVQKVKFTKPNYNIDAYLEWGACNDEMCMPPGEASLKKSGKSPAIDGDSDKSKDDEEKAKADEEAAEKAKADSLAALAALGDSASVDSAVAAAAVDSEGLWRPVIKELQASGSTDSLANKSLWYILLMGFIGGLLAVAMPCIWPIIPMTVSFFLKRAKSDKKKGIKDAITYGISIIVIYLALGLLVTALFGSDTLNAMSTNAVFNIFLFLLLVVFALSFFGWFEIKLPDRWANAVDTKASNTSGLLSIFLMAFTLVLVSFSCTAPIIGLLLVETTTSGNWVAPALGMFGFALALALPFTLFAMFPSWLKQAPRSGSWMTTIKIVLGFIELAFALKFFSVADLAYGWHLLDREVFLSLWIVIFGLLGAYLVGWLKFQEDEIGGDIKKPMPVLCIMGGLISFAFAIYMVPGLWGAPCKAVSAFAPPINTQDFNLNTKTVEARFTDYEQGMAAAKAEGKPAFIDFTGFGCVNCRKMEAAVWTDPRVADKLKKDYVLISLFVDDKTPLAEPYEVTDDQGNKKTLRTVGAKWSYLQSHKFGANAQPFYVIVDADGNPLSGSFSYKEDVPAFLDFLQGPLK